MRLSTSHGEVGASCLRLCLLAWFSSSCSAFYNPQRCASASAVCVACVVAVWWPCGGRVAVWPCVCGRLFVAVCVAV